MRVARAIGWVFVAFIGYHAVLAAADALRAGADRSWAALVAYGTIAAIAAVLVVGAAVHELRRTRRRVR